jgi:hypothetical protein
MWKKLQIINKNLVHIIYKLQLNKNVPHNKSIRTVHLPKKIKINQYMVYQISPSTIFSIPILSSLSSAPSKLKFATNSAQSRLIPSLLHQNLYKEKYIKDQFFKDNFFV